jgi:hypothetical protein
MRRICLIALALLSVAACGPSTTTPTPSPGGGSGGGQSEGGGPTLAPGATATPGASGSQGMSTGGQVTITSGSATVTLTADVTCHHAVVGGVGITTVLAGSQESGDGKPDGISMNIPDDPSLRATISGSLSGRAFALGPDARGRVEGNSGTWSGTDALGSHASFSGTFTCPSM